MHRDILKQLSWGAVEINLNATIQWVNPFFEEMMGFTLNELEGKNIIEFFQQNGIDKKQSNLYLDALKENRSVVFEVRLSSKDGNLKDMVVNALPVKDQAGNTIGSTGFCWDITSIKESHREIEQTAIDTRNSFIKESILAQEKQKERFGRQLYDGVLGTLAYTGLYLQKAAVNDRSNEILYENAYEKVKEAMNDVRRISVNLMSNAFNEIGLKEAMIDLINQYSNIQKTYFVLSCNMDDFKDIEFNAQRSIYRISEELIKNAATHAEASTVIIKFKRDENNLSFSIKDNGKGFDCEIDNQGLGLKSIKNITMLYAGSFNIKTNENKGTFCKIELPLEKICSVFPQNTDDTIVQRIQALRNSQ